MANRLKEQGFLNEYRARHDNVGNYLDMNGVRIYSRMVAMRDGDSTTVNGHQAIRGSLAKTTHNTGRDQLFQAGTSVWEAIGGEGGSDDVGGIAATGSYNFLRTPVIDESRLFNGIAFGWAAAADATHVVLVTVTPTNFNDTLLGVNLFNLVVKLNASVNGAITPATYSTNATGGHKNGTQIITTNDVEGIVGNDYTQGTADDTLATRSGATLAGGVDAIVSSQTYQANITQVTTGSPTASILLNELGGTAPAWARTSAGIYTLTKAGAFTVAKKPFFKNGAIVQFGSPNKVVFYSFTRTSDDVVTLNVAEVTYTAANDVTIAAKEISGMTVPLIPVEIIVSG